MRLLLEFEPSRPHAVAAENRLVQAHMRVAYSVPRPREYIRSGAPSEPIIAEAAARIMRNQNVMRKTEGWVRSGLISKGERGELVARLLFTLAHDKVVRSHHPNVAQDHPNVAQDHEATYSKPIGVSPSSTPCSALSIWT